MMHPSPTGNQVAVPAGQGSGESAPRVFRVLYVGELWQGGGSYHRMRVLEKFGHQVQAIDTRPPAVRQRERQLWYRLSQHLYWRGYDQIGPFPCGPTDLAACNRQILERAAAQTFDLLWLDKALTIERSTLEQVRQSQPWCRIVGYSPDDMGGHRQVQSRQFLEHLPLYDHFFTTKTFGVDELRTLGARNVHYVDFAYDEDVHRPIPVSADDRARFGGTVGFIGQHEEARGEAVVHLARAGIPVRVWGPGWRRHCPDLPHLTLEERWIIGDDYCRAMCAFDINLCFLRRASRDVSSTRSYEIPACAAFMLAERTAKHLELFREDHEAVYFDSHEEMVTKARYYLDHPEERRRIATAGHARCQASGYGNMDRMRGMLDLITLPDRP